MLQNLIRFSGAVVVTIIYLSFIAAALKIEWGFLPTFITVGINVAILFVMVNLVALIYGIITRKPRVSG